MASKCISKLAQLRPHSVSQPSYNHTLKLNQQTRSITGTARIMKFAQLHPPSSHDHSFQVQYQTRSITASNCISEHTLLCPPISLDHGLGVHLYTCTITA